VKIKSDRLIDDARKCTTLDLSGLIDIRFVTHQSSSIFNSDCKSHSVSAYSTRSSTWRSKHTLSPSISTPLPVAFRLWAKSSINSLNMHVALRRTRTVWENVTSVSIIVYTSCSMFGYRKVHCRVHLPCVMVVHSVHGVCFITNTDSHRTWTS
jgi:hypothetical protein